jgi:4-amino-4-deoxy-L-arabinose transferase-like glycosyltransferase
MAKFTLSNRTCLILILLLQVALTFGYELAHDEAYYWIFSKNLDWGYFDHPPMVAVFIRLFSFLPKSELAVRFGSIFLQYLTVEILFKLLPKENHRTAMWLFFAFPLASFGGLFALPDMPLLFMTALYFYCLRDFLQNKKWSILTLGTVIAMLLYSKYHGILLIFFTILALPKLLLKKEFWLVALVSIVLFTPHVWWQYQHDFATLRYHFLERPKADFSAKRLIEFLGVQVGLAALLAGPVVWWIVVKLKPASELERVMKWSSIGVVAFFFLSSFSKKFEANWTIFLAVPLIVLVAGSLKWNQRWPKILLMISLSIVFSARFLLILSPEGKLKRLKEFHGWEKWSLEIKSKCGADKKILANTYQIASKLSYYLNENIHALNLNSRKNQFDFWVFDPAYEASEVCYLTDKQEFSGEEVVTPESKKLKLVTNQYLQNLIELKRKPE